MSMRLIGVAFTLLAAGAGLMVANARAGSLGVYGKPVLSDNGAERQILKVGTTLPAGPGPNPLSVGHMQNFAFKTPTPLPDATFNDPSGKPITMAAFKGKVVLVNLWATWCVPCRKELPDLDKLAIELGSDKFAVVAISLDRGTPDKPRKLLEDLKLNGLKLYHDPSARLGFAWKAVGMPVTLLIDAEGRELGRLLGPAEWASEDAQRLIRAAIASGG